MSMGGYFYALDGADESDSIFETRRLRIYPGGFVHNESFTDDILWIDADGLTIPCKAGEKGFLKNNSEDRVMYILEVKIIKRR